MKICSKCSETKAESEYFVRSERNNRLHNQCKTCYKVQRKINYAKHYEKYKELYRARATTRRQATKTVMRHNMLNYLKDKFCVICEEDDIRTLEFDHIDPTTKSFNIARGLNDGYTWDQVLLEINKCRILCANCHKKHTSLQQNWYKNKVV